MTPRAPLSWGAGVLAVLIPAAVAAQSSTAPAPRDPPTSDTQPIPTQPRFDTSAPGTIRGVPGGIKPATAPPGAAGPTQPGSTQPGPGATATPADPETTPTAPGGATPFNPAVTNPADPAAGAPSTSSDPGQPSPRGPIAPIAPIVTGGEGEPIGPVATGHETRYLVPFQITGASDGRASARVGFGFLRGFGEVTDPTGWDVASVVEAEISTERGLATLVGLDREGGGAQAPTGSLRLSASFARLDFEGEGGSAYPPLVIYVGGRVGRTSFPYLAPRDPAAPQTLEQREEFEVPWGIGAAVVIVPVGWQKLAPTIEGQLAFDSRWSESAQTATWCVPVGEVPRDETPTATTPFDAAASCTTLALGAPSLAQEISLGAQVGLIDKVANATWRGALGFKVGIPLHENATEELRFSVRAPFYLTLARAPKGAEYRGLIRLMPSLNVSRLASGMTDVAGLLELSLLGQRGMFADHYDGF